MGNRQPQSRKRNRGGGPKETREGLGTKDIAQNGESADNKTAEEEAEEEIGHCCKVPRRIMPLALPAQ
jgi:hypothetical protein